MHQTVVAPALNQPKHHCWPVSFKSAAGAQLRTLHQAQADAVQQWVCLLMMAPNPGLLNAATEPLQGHSIECRINAEDPFKNFRPGPGRVVGYLAPGGPYVRMDSHLYPDYLVSL